MLFILPTLVNAQVQSELTLWPRSMMAPAPLPSGEFSAKRVLISFVPLVPVVQMPVPELKTTVQFVT